MGAGFFELNIGMSGLFTAQNGLSVTNNNIVNMKTEGYSRQSIKQQASRALPAAGRGMIGTGVDVIDINRTRDFYLDMKYWKQKNLEADYNVRATELSQVERMFNEPTDNGLNKAMDDLFASFQNLSTDTTTSTYYEQVKQSTIEMTTFFNSMGTKLTDMQESLNSDVKNKVNEINQYGEQIQRLNDQIYKLEINGEAANSLRDERDSIVDKLSAIANVEVEEIEMNPELKGGVFSAEDRIRSNKRFIVTINGQELVNHTKVTKLEVYEKPNVLNPEDQLKTYDIKWSNGLEFNENSPTLKGELKALLDIRDGNGGTGFYSKLVSADNTARTITVEGFDRTDLAKAGMVNINGAEYSYDSFTYDEATNQITFDVKTSFPVEDPTVDPTLPNIPFGVGAEVNVGSNNPYKGVPYYINKLNTLARTIAKAMNEGKRLDGSNIEGVNGSINGYTQSGETGMYMFAYKTGDGKLLGKSNSSEINYDELNIMNFSISAEFDENAKNIAISKSANPGESEADMIAEYLSIKHDKTLFKEGEPIDFVGAIMSQAAVDVNQNQNFVDIQEGMVNYIENRRLSVSGVEQNEEMTNLIKYQSAYQSAAKVISVMDEVYNTTINGLINV